MELDRETAQAELLAEEVTEDELRELLLRLGQAEFGGSENATVGAIVEATGRDATEVGRLLSGIRHEQFDRRFGLLLEEHDQRIGHLEEVTDEMRNRPPVTISLGPSEPPVVPTDRISAPADADGFGGIAARYRRSGGGRSLSREERQVIDDLVGREEQLRESWRYALLFALCGLLVLIALLSINVIR